MTLISHSTIPCFFIFCAIYRFAACDTCSFAIENRIDCYPEDTHHSMETCKARRCCYDPLIKDTNVPWCFYPLDYLSYQVTQFKPTKFGHTAKLVLDPQSPNRIADQVPEVTMDIMTETPTRLRVRLRDASKTRYEVPISTPKVGNATSATTLYSVDVASSGFGLTVKRSSSGSVLLNTAVGPLIYADQFLQMSTSLPTTKLYGLGERHEGALVSALWKRLLFWPRNQNPYPDTNLYGDHPFFIGIEDDGSSYGVFLLNSNAMEIELQPAPALTWRTIGGILDFYIFLGPSPEQVVQQYTEVVGRPFMPPYWGLGFHLCRYGYDSSDYTWNVVLQMRKARIPQDVQWNDIDYMRSYLDFTYDHSMFGTLPLMLDDLHSNGQHYVMIIDPGISNQEITSTYPAYDDGLEMDVFIKDGATGAPLEGKVWPGKVVFPDFTHPNASSYWLKQLQSYHEMVPFDGVWIDMNEPSNFVDGSTSGCLNGSLDHPPYTPHVLGGSLRSGTVCMSAKQHAGVHYDLHSLTGLLEMRATSEAVSHITGKRPFVISRSTFPSAGKYGGHWSGDIHSTWQDLKQSVTSVISFNMFGVPLVGADICGFGENTTEELCTRWMQLGAFYPFSRNHNSLHSSPQAPIDFSFEAQDAMRSVLMMRYALLPYLYTLFYQSHIGGGTVARGLFFEFPNDASALLVDQQFMWGSGLLISPVLDKGATSVQAYFPPGVWYSLVHFGESIESSGQWETIPAPLNETVVHFRGGHVIPGEYPDMTTTKSRANPKMLFVAPDKSGSASGSLFWDDGVSLDSIEGKKYLLTTFRVSGDTLTSNVVNSGPTAVKLSTVYWMGVGKKPSAVTVNGASVDFAMKANNVLQISLSFDLNKAFVMKLAV